MSILTAFNNTQKVKTSGYSSAEINLASKYLDLKKAELQKEQMATTSPSPTATTMPASEPDNKNKNNKESNLSMKKQSQRSTLTAIIETRTPAQGLLQKLGIFQSVPVHGRYVELYERNIKGEVDGSVDPASSESNATTVAKGRLHQFEYNFVHSVQDLTAADVAHRLSLQSGLKEVEALDDLQADVMCVQQDNAERTRHQSMVEALISGTQTVKYAKLEENRNIDLQAEFGAYATAELDVTESADVLVQLDTINRDIRKRCGELNSDFIGLIALCGSSAFISVTNHKSVSSVKALCDGSSMLLYQEQIAGFNSKTLKNMLFVDTAAELEGLASDQIIIVPVFKGKSNPFQSCYGNHTRQIDKANGPAQYLAQYQFDDAQGKVRSIQSEYSYLSIVMPDLITKVSLKTAAK